MMSVLFKEEGAALRIDILREPEVESFIQTHADILDSAFAKAEMSDSMRENLQRSDYIFSGFKTFHELGEAFPSLVDQDGRKKPFNRFFNDVKKIDKTYNERYLRAEYNFVSASSEMAAHWEQFAKNEEEYYLQYRTANDGAVRPEHAALHDVTLPASDTFWDSYYPPNGWNCRCTVVQILKYMHEATPHDEAMRRGAQALAKDKKEMFNFNPGKQQKTFPDYNPYTISKCRGCTKANLKLFAGDPDNPLCQACVFLKTEVCGYETIPTEKGRVRQHRTQSPDEREENKSIALYLANKYGHDIDLMPKIDNKPRVKNADSFNHTLGYKQEYKVNTKNTYNSYDMAIKEGRKQASSLVLKISDNADLNELSHAMHNRCSFVKKNRVSNITVIWRGLDCTYSEKAITSDGFKIRKEDFK